jgi:hypothetical protein
MINSWKNLKLSKERGEAAHFRGFSLPPQAAKCVRTIFNIERKILLKKKTKFLSKNPFWL